MNTISGFRPPFRGKAHSIIRLHRFTVRLQPEDTVAAGRHVRAFPVCDSGTLATSILPTGDGPKDNLKLVDARCWRMPPAIADIIA